MWIAGVLLWGRAVVEWDSLSLALKLTILDGIMCTRCVLANEGTKGYWYWKEVPACTTGWSIQEGMYLIIGKWPFCVFEFGVKFGGPENGLIVECKIWDMKNMRKIYWNGNYVYPYGVYVLFRANPLKTLSFVLWHITQSPPIEKSTYTVLETMGWVGGRWTKLKSGKGEFWNMAPLGSTI